MGSKVGRLAVLAVATTGAAAGAAATRMEKSASSSVNLSLMASDDDGGAVTFTRPPPPYSGGGGGRPGLQLSLVQVLSRHGDRTSINPLPFETHEQWKPLLPTEAQVAALDSRARPVPPSPELVNPDSSSRSLHWHGQLTAQGVAQLVNTGEGLRAWLVGEGLLPPTMEEARDAGLVKIRSTGTRRTLQSAQSLIFGLYPPSSSSSSSRAAPFAVEVRDRARESMFPNPGMACGRQLELMHSLDGDVRVEAAEAEAWGRGGLSALRDEVHARNVQVRGRLRREQAEQAEQASAAATAAAVVAGSSPITSSRGKATVASVSEIPATQRQVQEQAQEQERNHKVEAAVTTTSAAAVPERLKHLWHLEHLKHLRRDPRPPSATSVWEPLQARANHGLPLPDGVDAADLAAVRRAAEVRHIHRAASAEAAALAGGRLLRELAEEAHAVAAVGTAPQRLSVYAGHDSTIIALLAVLGAFENGQKWPPVASTVIVETWSGGRGGVGGANPHWSSRARSAGGDDDGGGGGGGGVGGGGAGGGVGGGGSVGEHMVRVVFNGRIMQLPGCEGQEPLHRGGLCTLEAFRAMADARDPRDYEAACRPKGQLRAKM